MTERSTLALVEPTETLQGEILALIDEFAAAGEERYRQMLERALFDMPGYVGQLEAESRGVGLLPGCVPQTTFWTVEDGRWIVGVVRLHRAGVRIHLGTDTAAAPFVVPGLSLQQELRCMVEAGLSLEEAWAAGTRAAGESLGLAGLGTVRQGAPADLLVFAQHPTRDLEALNTLQAVVAQGRLYSRATLEEALARHRARFERPFYDRWTTGLLRLAMKAVPGQAV